MEQLEILFGQTTVFTEAITVHAPEQLGNIQVPKRASYIIVIMLELSRIASYLLWLGPFMADIGAQTPFFYIYRERELIYELLEAVTGMRMMHNFFFVLYGEDVIDCEPKLGYLHKVWKKLRKIEQLYSIFLM
ncbi:hypothetical protein R6Q57_000981 [Mikania cordata]